MMQINMTENCYIQFYVSVYARPINKTRGQSLDSMLESVWQ